MKKHPQTKMTPLQQAWLLRAVVLLLLLGLVWVLFAPGNGIYAIFSKRHQVESLDAETLHLQKDNAVLQGEIDKMKNDPAYLEKVARRDFGLLKPNERVYDFSRPEKEDKD
ncbi:MAG: FtsB family cell division protein [Desulfopila sp.]